MIEQLIQKYKDMLTKKITYSERVLINQMIVDLEVLKDQVQFKSYSSISKEISQMFKPESKEAVVLYKVGDGLEKIAAIIKNKNK